MELILNCKNCKFSDVGISRNTKEIGVICENELTFTFSEFVNENHVCLKFERKTNHKINLMKNRYDALLKQMEKNNDN